MLRHRDDLPQLKGEPFLTDGGLETTLLFQYGMDLPAFPAFPLLDTEDGPAADEAAAYHSPQIEAFAASDADLVSTFTLNYVDEAIGIVAAARSHGMPVVVSFTVETDGTTDTYPAYYMINCAHPTHVLTSVTSVKSWRHRIQGVRANASAKSHVELNEATELDEGDPEAFGALHHELKQAFPRLSVIGGGCGTDHRHVVQAGMTLRPASS